MSEIPPQVIVANEVRAAMARRRISQAVLAEKSNMATSTLQRRLAGESDFTVSELYRIAATLGIAVQDLFGQAVPA